MYICTYAVSAVVLSDFNDFYIVLSLKVGGVELKHSIFDVLSVSGPWKKMACPILVSASWFAVVDIAYWLFCGIHCALEKGSSNLLSATCVLLNF